jgi:HD-GYP domain-containing protein (c-di-GMP phosphodiesterase class II)
VVVRPGLEKSVLEPHGEVWRNADRVEYRTLYVDKLFSVHVFVPLKDRAGNGTGYFEGIYQVDRKTMSDIKGRIASSLAQVAVVVLVTTVMLYPVIIALNKDLMRLTVNLSHANLGMLKVLGSAVAKRDSDTNIHNYRVTLYAVRLAETVGLGAAAVKSLIKGAFLHDVGKIGISDAILLKPGKLSPEEFEMMKTHPRHGADIIGGYAWLQDAMEVVTHHHEKFDGTGYPAGLKGEAIPLAARIFMIADVFDALTSRRPYKAPLPFKETMTILERESGVFHDPELLAVFRTQADALFREIGNTDDAVLDKMLDDHIRRYFPEG